MSYYSFDEVRDRFLKVPNKPLYNQHPSVNSSKEFSLNMANLLKKATTDDIKCCMSSDISSKEYEQLMSYIDKGLTSNSPEVVKVAKQYQTYINSMIEYDKNNPPVEGLVDSVCDDDLVQKLYNNISEKAKELAELENPSLIDNLFGNKNSRNKKIWNLQQEIKLTLNQWYLEIHKKITNNAVVSADRIISF